MTIRVVLFLVCMVLTACARPQPFADTQVPISESLSSSVVMQDVTLVSPDGERRVLHVELARTPAERERGLMGRKKLPEDAGMLFVFPAPQPLFFWMKDTLIPLDVVYFDAEGRFVSAAAMEPCPPASPCPSYASTHAALYALEVKGGSAAQWGVGEGWKLEVQEISGVE